MALFLSFLAVVLPFKPLGESGEGSNLLGTVTASAESSYLVGCELRECTILIRSWSNPNGIQLSQRTYGDSGPSATQTSTLIGDRSVFNGSEEDRPKVRIPLMIPRRSASQYDLLLAFCLFLSK